MASLTALPVSVLLGRFVLVALLATACVTDVRARRIPNWVVAAIAVVGVVAASSGRSPGVELVGAVEGMALGLAMWLPFYALNMLGAGDVKLFAAAAAWLGVRGAIEGALLSALAGGVVALVMMIAGQGIGLTVLRVGVALRDPSALQVTPSRRASRVPYALAIAAGVLGALFWPELL